MIDSFVIGSIFNAKERHILIPINIEGDYSSGIAKEFAEKCHLEIKNTYGDSKLSLGTIIRMEWNGKIIYALACYSLDPEIGWKEAPGIILECLDNDIVDSQSEEIAFDEAIATIMMGQSEKSKILGANPNKIRNALQESKRMVIIYTK
jgi:hypothetical protein